MLPICATSRNPKNSNLDPIDMQKIFLPGGADKGRALGISIGSYASFGGLPRGESLEVCAGLRPPASSSAIVAAHTNVG
jgi:hypothetical protein